MKRIIIFVLCLILCAGTLSGCNFFAHNYETDYSQPIVTIAPMTETVKTTETLNEFDEVIKPSVEIEYTFPGLTIYKYQLVNRVNQKASEMMNAGQDPKAIVEQLLEELIQSELKQIEADKMFYVGEIFWTADEVAELQRIIYNYIDDEIRSFKNALLTDQELPTIGDASEEASKPETTYPAMPDYDSKDDKYEQIPYYKNPVISKDNPYQWYDAWYLDEQTEWFITDPAHLGRIPGYYATDAQEKSLCRNAMTAYLTKLTERSTQIIGISAAEQATIDGEITMLKNIASKQSPEAIYPYLGKTLLFKKLVGDYYLKSVKESKHKTYLEDKIKIYDEEIQTEYNRTLAQQLRDFTNQAAYDKAIEDVSVILYTPSSRYLFVKHILLPFSDADKAAYENYKKSTKNEKKQLEFRDNLAKNMTVYPIVNGEHDMSDPKTVAFVMDEVYSQMNRFASSARLAERQFDVLTYKYNTDPGAFDNNRGYAVVYERLRDNEGNLEAEKFMTEFAEGAREFRAKGYSVGSVLDHYVVTDYGIHIMYYASDPIAGYEAKLNHYTTPAEYFKIKDVIMENIKANRLENEYASWEAKYIFDARERDKFVSVETKRLKNLYE